MINRIKDFLENRRIRKILKRTSEDIFTTFMEFDDLYYKHLKRTSSIDKLLMFCILTVASDRSPATFENRFNKVLDLYYRNLKIAVSSKTFRDVNELQKMKAKVELSKTQYERTLGFEYYKKDKYLFESMQYSLEIVNKAPITPEQLLLIKNTSSELEELNKKIEEIEKEKTKQNTV